MNKKKGNNPRNKTKEKNNKNSETNTRSSIAELQKNFPSLSIQTITHEYQKSGHNQKKTIDNLLSQSSGWTMKKKTRKNKKKKNKNFDQYPLKKKIFKKSTNHQTSTTVEINNEHTASTNNKRNMFQKKNPKQSGVKYPKKEITKKSNKSKPKTKNDHKLDKMSKKRNKSFANKNQISKPTKKKTLKFNESNVSMAQMLRKNTAPKKKNTKSKSKKNQKKVHQKQNKKENRQNSQKLKATNFDLAHSIKNCSTEEEILGIIKKDHFKEKKHMDINSIIQNQLNIKRPRDLKQSNNSVINAEDLENQIISNQQNSYKDSFHNNQNHLYLENEYENDNPNYDEEEDFYSGEEEEDDDIKQKEGYLKQNNNLNYFGNQKKKINSIPKENKSRNVFSNNYFSHQSNENPELGKSKNLMNQFPFGLNQKNNLSFVNNNNNFQNNTHYQPQTQTHTQTQNVKFNNYWRSQQEMLSGNKSSNQNNRNFDNTFFNNSPINSYFTQNRFQSTFQPNNLFSNRHTGNNTRRAQNNQFFARNSLLNPYLGNKKFGNSYGFNNSETSYN
ncbi:hypothetical protein M0812_21054 [Anaeramoeba flamelloides]|uniref:CUE domain-containing protein n=1 Tax=Anaeramoeba flamelloides TaxID=1746091 RepID=A0AAV7YWL8_9EUKA|nr:hypothetical protein M0812_21054 [Anaeramoeba flamelloides]